jgi:hypothetical protein
MRSDAVIVRPQEAYEIDAAVAAVGAVEILDTLYTGIHEKELHPALRAALRNYRSKRARARASNVASHVASPNEPSN